MVTSRDNALGRFLKDRRGKLDPATFGFSSTRRRTPGLRREEVAQRANISVTWYTWLEQGRGGVPSADVLKQIANALALTPAEREHLFLLAFGRQPAPWDGPPGTVSPRLQRVLDSLELSPAFVKTSAWDVVAWNRAAAAVLTDYGALPVEERNILSILFCDSDSQVRLPNWEQDARFAVATFRLEISRSGFRERAAALVDELSRASSAFASLWCEQDVSAYGEGIKRIEHGIVGSLMLEYASFAVDDQPDLGLVIYTPASVADRDRVRVLVEHSAASPDEQLERLRRA